MHDFVRTSMISSCFQLFLETLCLPTPITTGQFWKPCLERCHDCFWLTWQHMICWYIRRRLPFWELLFFLLVSWFSYECLFSNEFQYNQVYITLEKASHSSSLPCRFVKSVVVAGTAAELCQRSHSERNGMQQGAHFFFVFFGQKGFQEPHFANEIIHGKTRMHWGWESFWKILWTNKPCTVKSTPLQLTDEKAIHHFRW